MDYFLSKLLPLFVYPLGFSIVLGILAAIFIMLTYHRSAFFSALFGMVMLWVSAMPIFSNDLLTSLESEYPPLILDEIVEVDAIVILGRGVGGIIQEGKPPDLGMSVDRLFYGWQLFKAKKAPIIIVSGGAVPSYISEAEMMVALLQELGVNDNNILIENRSRNTRENALFTFDIMKQRNISEIILVTSAFHMPRALATFQTLDINVIPAATDYNVTEPQFRILNWMPDAGALYKTTYVFKEYIGWFYYCMKGWIGEC